MGQPREQRLDSATALRLAGLFKSLSDPTRLRILAALAGRELCVHELTELLELKQSTISHSLRLMRDRGLVRHRREGRHVYYALEDRHVYELFQRGREHVVHQHAEEA